MSRMQKRITNYNIGKANKSDYKYYRKTKICVINRLSK